MTGSKKNLPKEKMLPRFTEKKQETTFFTSIAN
jgi:hypothetical protein